MCARGSAQPHRRRRCVMDWLDPLCKFVDTHEAHGEAIEDSARIDEQGRSIMTLRCRMCGASIEIELYEQNAIEATVETDKSVTDKPVTVVHPSDRPVY